MSGDEIGVKMRQEYMFDLECVLAGKCNVLVYVTLWVDDNGRARRFVSDHVRSVRQTRQIKLLKNHPVPSSFAGSYWLGNDPQIRLRRFPPARVLLLSLVIRNAAADDDVLAWFPVHRSGDLVLSRELQ